MMGERAIAIVDYGMGNLRSVQKGFERVGVEAQVTSDPRQVRRAPAVVLPGVGAFATAMANLERTGLAEAVLACVQAGKPLLGICLGLQLLFEESEERFAPPGGATAGWPLAGRMAAAELAAAATATDGAEGQPLPRGLGLLRGRVRRLPAGLKVPQIGWNQIRRRGEPPLFAGIPDGSYVYFVHSYYVDPVDPGVVATTTEYGLEFCSSVWAGNLHAIQFHPEKSSRVGLAILRNFGRVVARCG